MTIKLRGGVVAGVIVALIVAAFVIVGVVIVKNVVGGVSEGIGDPSEIINGPSLESTLDDAIADFGADAPVVGLVIRPQDMVYDVLTGPKVTQRQIFVEETSRYDPAQNREVSGATVKTNDSTRKAGPGERKGDHPALGDLDPAAQDRMAEAAGVPASRLTAELEGDHWLVQAKNGRTIKTELDGTVRDS